MPHGVFERGAHQALGARPAHGLDPNTHGCHRLVAKSNFLKCRGHFRWRNSSNRSAGLPPGNQCRHRCLPCFAEDDHVHLLRVFHRRGLPEILHRAQAHIQVEHLAQRDVERADAATDGGRERALMPTRYSLGRDRVIRQRYQTCSWQLRRHTPRTRQPGAGRCRPSDRRVKHALAGGKYRADAVAADERQYRVGRHVQFAVDGKIFSPAGIAFWWA